MDKNEISGIRCHVENCVYHTGDCCCEAGCIEVGTSGRESETSCKTFQAKEI